jgi:outer membrane lipoprotein SlyB
MKAFRNLISISVMAALLGCATLPTGPSVRVLPSKGKSFDTFQKEDANCRQWAERSMGAPVQETYDRNLATGAITGTAVGTGLGAAIGSASGNAGTGAAVGALSGLFIGAAAGSSSGQLYGAEAQRRYDTAYTQCMYSHGNQLPGTVTARVVVPPPPPPVYAPSYGVPEDLSYPQPPDIYLPTTPEFIYTPDLGMYVAVGVPYDLVYVGNEYFCFSNGRWFRSTYYNGPWVMATRNHYPGVLYRYNVENIRHYRDIEYRRYEHDRGHYDGNFHRPEYRGYGEGHSEGHGERHR